jgi:hypothetical protein
MKATPTGELIRNRFPISRSQQVFFQIIVADNHDKTPLTLVKQHAPLFPSA